MTDLPDLERYAKRLGTGRDDVRGLLVIARQSADGARIARSVLRAELRRAGLDPDDDDPFTIAPTAYDLGGEGVQIGMLSNGSVLVWRHGEIAYSGIWVGSPGSGKTNSVLDLCVQLSGHYTVVAPDLRGDYEPLVRVIPGARLFAFGEFPVNILRGPSRVPPPVFNQRFVEVFTDMFDLFQASRRYLNLVLDSLEAKRAETGHWPCLLDLKDELEGRREERGSSELEFRNRCLARVDAICRALGEKSVGVEQGIDLEWLIEQKTVLIFRMELERSIQDFLTNWLALYMFTHRAFAEDKFNQRPLIFVLDEQRSLLRTRR
jgi:hypothetical protein